MDAKSLAVLQKLKDQLSEAKPKRPLAPAAFSDESVKAIEEVARRNLSGERPQRLPPDLIRKCCAECSTTYAIEPKKDRRRWVCASCLRAHKLRKREAKEAKLAAQYQKASGTRIDRIQRAIDSVNARITETPECRQVGLLRQLRELEQLLAIERVHTISKIRQIRPQKVSGSYGTGRRTN